MKDDIQRNRLRKPLLRMVLLLSCLLLIWTGIRAYNFLPGHRCRALIESLPNRTPTVYDRCLAALGLSPPPLENRDEIVDSLVSLGHRAVPVLLKYASDDVPQIRLVAMEALVRGYRARPEVRVCLLESLNDEECFVRHHAAMGLLKDGPDRSATAVLMKDLRSGNNIERWSAASQLREAGSAAADLLPDLLSAIEDTDGCVREMVVGALGRIGKSSPEVRRALAIALRNDAYVPVRSEAAKVLGLLRANDSESIAALQKAKSDPSTSVRLSAEGSLKSLGH